MTAWRGLTAASNHEKTNVYAKTAILLCPNLQSSEETRETDRERIVIRSNFN